MTIKKLLLSSLVFTGMVHGVSGQGFSIQIRVEGLSDTSIYVGYHFADKKYVKDTIHLDSRGECVFRGKEPLPGGIYLLVMPSMDFIEFLVADDQDFSITTDMTGLLKNLAFSGSEENSKFLAYQHFMMKMQTESESLRKKREEFKNNQDSVTAINQRLRKMDSNVREYWISLGNYRKGSLVSNLVNALVNPEMPEFSIPEETENQDSLRWIMGYRFNRDHFLDHIDFTDERLLRTPVLYNKLDQYFNNVLIQHPDSIIPQVSRVVALAEQNEKVFQFVVVFLLNNFQKSSIMGMDEVYVRIAEDYYLSGRTSWADSTFLANLEDRVEKIKPNLIGRTGKELIMETVTGEWVSLHQVRAKYTILYFWEPNCGHCKEATPLLYSTYTKFRDRGLEVFAVYTQDKKEEWQEYLDKNGYDWINAWDPKQSTFFRYYYDVYSTPVIYLLDGKKTIVAKRISVESLDKMLEGLM